MNVFVLIVGMVFVFNLPDTRACSTAAVPESGAKVMGKNYVWPYRHGRLFVNRQHMRKRALVNESSSVKPHSWVARYPSLTFNQVSENFPNGGINSEGLAIEILLASAQFPRGSSKPAVNELQWIQYLLDTSRDVAEATSAARRVEIIPLGNHSLHYHACDKSGHCAVYEYHGGRLVVSDEANTGENPVGVTNATYASGFGEPDAGAAAPPPNFPEPELITLPGVIHRGNPSERILGLLDRFKQKNYTRASDEVSGMYEILTELAGSPAWQIVYELANGKVHFNLAHTSVSTAQFSAFNPGADTNCRAATAVDLKTKRRYVFPPLRYNLAQNGKPELGRDDFTAAIDPTPLLTESARILSGAGVDEATIKRMRGYAASHTACVLD